MAVPSPRSSSLQKTLLAPLAWSGKIEEWARKIAEVANSLRDGKINTVGTVTLTSGSTTTTLTDARINPQSFIGLMPITATAQAGFIAGMRIVCATGTATITHNSTADADRQFQYAILG